MNLHKIFNFLSSASENKNNLAIAILRWSMALVLLYFGISQLYAPSNWIGYLPHALSESAFAAMIIMANGAIEILAALLLFAGLFTKITALIMAIHLAAITINIGFSATGVRDFGLTFTLLALVLFESDKYSLDKKQEKNN